MSKSENIAYAKQWFLQHPPMNGEEMTEYMERCLENGFEYDGEIFGHAFKETFIDTKTHYFTTMPAKQTKSGEKMRHVWIVGPIDFSKMQEVQEKYAK